MKKKESTKEILGSKGKNLTDIQDMNRSLVLRLLKRKNICSRAELAQLTGLRQATITNIINDFIQWGLVKEIGLMSGNRGRRSIGLQINNEDYYVIGVRLTRDFFMVGLFNILGENILTKTVDNDKHAGPIWVVDSIKKEVKKIIKEHADKRILGIGVAVPGPYLPEEGKISAIADFPGWNEICLKSELTKTFDIPLIIDHDANAGALAEWWGVPSKSENETSVYIAVGQGVGSGITIDGKIFRGAIGTAGEIGHMSINFNGPVCECGNRGCLTHYASTTNFIELVKARMTDYPDTIVKENFQFEDLVDALNKKDTLVVDAFREIMKYLSIGIVNIICAYGPSEIVIGDEMSAVGDYMIDTLKEIIDGNTYDYFSSAVKIRLSTYKIDPAYIGAATLAIDYALRHIKIFEDNFLKG